MVREITLSLDDIDLATEAIDSLKSTLQETLAVPGKYGIAVKLKDCKVYLTMELKDVG